MYFGDLFKLKILTPRRIVRLFFHVFRNGIQLSNVIHMCGDKTRIALKHNDTSVTYGELFRMVSSVSGYVHEKYKVKQGSHVLVIVENSIPSVVLMLALSALGCNIHIIRALRDYQSFLRTVDLEKYDFVFSGIEEQPDYYHHNNVVSITQAWDAAANHKGYEPFVRRRTTLSVFTSGTTGYARRAGRSNTLWQYLGAISDVAKTLRLPEYRAVLLPVPIYHSYGLSTLFLGLMLNKPVILVNKFDLVQVGNAIRTNQVEMVVLIPQMLNRLLSEDLKGLRCIVSCADVLPIGVLQKARARFGDIIFNLYGTSEAGLSTIATPAMLAVRPDTIGKPVRGCEIRLVEEDGYNILHVKSRFAISAGYVRTGDIASVDENGWYYIYGRADDLIVVNGINVYPSELMRIAYEHEAVQYAGVKTFPDGDGFRRIRMTLLVKPGTTLNDQQFKDWWVSRHGAKLVPAVVDVKTDDDDIKLMGS